MGLYLPDRDSNRTPSEARLARRVALVTVAALVALMAWVAAQPHRAYDPDPPCTQQAYSAEQC